jgi:Na+-driven multidrug efflux pump
MISNIIVSPYWSAYTEAYIKKDFQWMKRSLNQLLIIWVVLACATGILLLVADYMYYVWVGEKVKIDFSVSLSMMIYVVVMAFGDVHIRFLNGIGNVKPQMIVNMIGMVFFVPLCYLLAKVLGMGVPGIIVAMILCNLYGPLIAPFQVRSFLNKQLS